MTIGETTVFPVVSPTWRTLLACGSRLADCFTAPLPGRRAAGVADSLTVITQCHVFLRTMTMAVMTIPAGMPGQAVTW